ncbi:MAG: helix-turn-helix domain-containing protein [Pseudonocardia sp.]|nr:helix-turn-helix domain-containing protein [Pseudonocardia sp.]
MTAAQAAHAQQLYDGGEHTVAQIAALLGVARTTVYGHLDRATSQAGVGPVARIGSSS